MCERRYECVGVGMNLWAYVWCARMYECVGVCMVCAYV